MFLLIQSKLITLAVHYHARLLMSNYKMASYILRMTVELVNTTQIVVLPGKYKAVQVVCTKHTAGYEGVHAKKHCHDY